MIHQRQRLPLGLKPGDDTLGVHAQLDDFERHPPAHRFFLLGHINHAAAAFADSLQQLVRPDALSDGFVLLGRLVNIVSQARRVQEGVGKLLHPKPRHAAFLENFFRRWL